MHFDISLCSGIKLKLKLDIGYLLESLILISTLSFSGCIY